MKKEVSIHLRPCIGYTSGPNIIRSDETGHYGMIAQYGIADACKSFTPQQLIVTANSTILPDDWIFDTWSGKLAQNKDNKITSFNEDIKKIIGIYPRGIDGHSISVPSIPMEFIRKLVYREFLGPVECEYRPFDAVVDKAGSADEFGYVADVNTDGNLILSFGDELELDTKSQQSADALARAMEMLGRDGVNKIIASIPRDPSAPRITETMFLLDNLNGIGTDAAIAKLAHDIYMNCFRAPDDMDYVEQTTDIFNRIKAVFGVNPFVDATLVKPIEFNPDVLKKDK